MYTVFVSQPVYDNGATSNFSWDFMYQYFDPKEEVSISGLRIMKQS